MVWVLGRCGGEIVAGGEDLGGGPGGDLEILDAELAPRSTLFSLSS